MVIQPWLLPSRVCNELFFKSAEAFYRRRCHRFLIQHESGTSRRESIAIPPNSVPSLHRYTSPLLQPAPPPKHMQLMSLKMLICFCGPSYSPRKSPRVVHIIPAPSIHRTVPLPSRYQQFSSTWRLCNNNTMICARETRYDAPTIEYGAHLLGQYGNALCISGKNLDGDYAAS